MGSVRTPIIPDPPTWGRPLFLEVYSSLLCVFEFYCGELLEGVGSNINLYHLEEMFRSIVQGLGSRKPWSFSQWASLWTLGCVHSTRLCPCRTGLYAQVHWVELK